MKQADGFVSLFTAIMISMLLLVITVSLVSLETLQLRKAADAEQTLRAYYAAEAGVEDAVSKVLSNPTNRTDQTCSTGTIPGAAGWTCQKISFSGTPFGKLEAPDVAKTIDPGNINYQSILLEWDQSTNAAAGRYNVNLTGGFPSDASYKSLYSAAPVEMSIVQYPTGGFKASDVGTLVKLQNAVIVPGGASAGMVNYSAANFKTSSPFKGNCVPNRVTGFGGRATTYNCYAVISGFTGGSDYMFRIRSRYMASAYKMTFYTGNNATGSVVDIPDGTATIDVTGKAGQTYRRVISKLPLNNSASAGLNYVIYSDGDVCKNFSVFDNVPAAGCPY